MHERGERKVVVKTPAQGDEIRGAGCPVCGQPEPSSAVPIEGTVTVFCCASCAERVRAVYAADAARSARPGRLAC